MANNFNSIFGDTYLKQLEAGCTEQYKNLSKYALLISVNQKMEALTKLLISKGVFTEDEWKTAYYDEENNGRFAEVGNSICEDFNELNHIKEVIDSKDYDKLMEMVETELEEGDSFANIFKDGKNPFA